MIIDRYNSFSIAQAITASAPSTDIIDLAPNSRDIGAGTRLHVGIFVGVAAGAGAMTLTIALQGAPNNAGVPGTWEDLALSPAYTAAQLAAGTKLFPITWPAKTTANTLHRFLRLNYTVASGPFVGLTLNAFLLLDRQDIYAYPPGITIAN